MVDTKTRSIGDNTQNELSFADSKQEFHHIIRHGNKMQITRAILREFFTESSILGLKYFCERKRHWSEKIFWMIMFVVGTALSGFMIYESYIRWDDTPVVVSLKEKATPVWRIPFPAVTICPEVKINSKMLNLTQTLHTINQNIQSNQDVFANITEEKIGHLKSLTQICNIDMTSNLKFGKTVNATLIQDLYRISIKIDKSLDDCEWRSKNESCSKLFRPILTEEGFCFTFNSFNSRDIYADNVAPELLSVTGNSNATDWSLGHEYNDTVNGTLSLGLYPFRILGTGTPNGLQFTLSLYKDDLDYMCQGPVQGFKVSLSVPAQIPQPSTDYFRVPLDQEVLVSVKPKVFETAGKLKRYLPEQKFCYMQTENPLGFFKVYTQRHCELECTSNFTRDKCGCVDFSHPRLADTPICGIENLECMTKIEEEMVKLSFLQNLNKSSDNRHQTCKCLPACTSIDYEIELSSAQYDAAKYLRARPERPLVNFNEIAYASLTIYFKEKQFFALKRSLLYDYRKFLAECGGILGLFIGVSALSIVEIFYYFTLRCIWTLQMYRCAKNKDGSINLPATPVMDTS